MPRYKDLAWYIYSNGIESKNTIKYPNSIDIKELEFLLRYPYVPNLTTPVDFLNDQSWGGIKSLSSMEEFHNLDRDIEGRRLNFNIYKF